MWGYLRKNAATVVVAMATAAVTAGAPAIAHGVKHALFAHDSAAVDGKSAVGAEATKKQRKGKLVATDPVTGRLPNSLIKKAPNANKLDGLDSTAFLRTDAKAADADQLDGFDSSAFLQNSGAITIQGSVTSWVKDSASGSSGTATVAPEAEGTRITSTSASGSATYVMMPDLPVSLYGKLLKLTGVEICYGADSSFVIDTLALEEVANVAGVPARTTTNLDTVDRSDSACRSYALDLTLAPNEGLGVSVEGIWTATAESLELGRVTFTLVPTDLPPS
jgi:hypothetical protein